MSRIAPAVPPEDKLQRTLFTALFVVWGALLAGALVLGVQGSDTAELTAKWLRMASSLALVATGGAAWLWFFGTNAAWYVLCAAIGITLGTVGDFYNAGLLDDYAPLGEGVLGGIAAFGLGHIAYITGCQIAARQTGRTAPAPLYGSLALWLAIGAVGWYAIVYLGATEKTSALVWPALAYTLLLASMAGLAMGLALQDRRFTMLAVGAAFFFVSDLVLAIGMFRGSFPWQTEVVWLLYGPGQMMIVFSALAIGRILAVRERGEPA
jgi:hypothetical protein